MCNENFNSKKNYSKLKEKQETAEKRSERIHEGYGEKFLKDKLAPKIADMEVKKVILCIDKGLAFKEEEAKEQLRLGGATNVTEVWILPRTLRSTSVLLIITFGTRLNSECEQKNHERKQELQEY